MFCNNQTREDAGHQYNSSRGDDRCLKPRNILKVESVKFAFRRDIWYEGRKESRMSLEFFFI